MCLWLITACLGMLPTHPSPSVVVVGVPSPILIPTAAPTTTTTTTTRTTTVTIIRPNPPMTGAPTMPPTASSAATTGPPAIPPTSPITGAPTMATPAPTMATPAPTMATPALTMATPAPTMATPAPTMATPAHTVAPTVAPTPPPTTLGAVPLSVLVCNNPDAICVSNPDDDAGPIQIDPRLGSSPPPYAALQAPPQISPYSAQVEPYNSAVTFPRDKRSTGVERSVNVKEVMTSYRQKLNDTHEIRKRQTYCRCEPTGTYATGISTVGGGTLDVRIVTPGATTCPAGQVYCCGATSSVACGVLQTVPATSVVLQAGQANFGEFPWQALVLSKQNDYVAGGVLIDQLHVLTVTHRLVNYVVSGTAPNVKVRLGEWDAASTTEPVAFQEFNVARVFTHPSYTPTTLQYDLTVLRLAAPVPLTPSIGAAATINRACLPASAATVFTGQRCYVAGWGKNMFGIPGQYQQIMKKVDVPIVAPATCQMQLQAARLGASYVLDTTSFVCAGGETNKDACTGDGGSGLVCNQAGSWVVVGLVSWGLGCANTNVPGVYVNVAALLPWIQQQIATA